MPSGFLECNLDTPPPDIALYDLGWGKVFFSSEEYLILALAFRVAYDDPSHPGSTLAAAVPQPFSGKEQEFFNLTAVPFERRSHPVGILAGRHFMGIR